MEEEKKTANMTRYVNEWRKKNAVQFRIVLTKSTDQDIIERLEQVGNRQGYIKELIRKDIKRSK